MATSGTRDGAFTVQQICNEAMSLLQIGIGGETTGAEDLATCITTLKLMGRAWSLKGVKLFLNETQSVTLANGTAAYAITKRPLHVFQAYRRASDNDVPVRLIAREEYSRLPDKTTSGPPSQVWIDRTVTATTAYVWPVPGAAEVSAAMTMRFDIKRPIEDVTAGSEDMEVPPEAIPAVTYNLAIWIAPKFNKTPSNEVKMLAADTFSDFEGQDREHSVYMRPARRWR